MFSKTSVAACILIFDEEGAIAGFVVCDGSSDLTGEVAGGGCDGDAGYGMAERGKIAWHPKPGIAAVVESVNGVPIRLSEERWSHI
ncbi:MAG: hypothetical protein JRI56_08995, partial [Deltaproteobacteria bacterium]|nr:hypothetical protein [Deltaproteobacteria bacterium]